MAGGTGAVGRPWPQLGKGVGGNGGNRGGDTVPNRGPAYLGRRSGHTRDPVPRGRDGSGEPCQVGSVLACQLPGHTMGKHALSGAGVGSRDCRGSGSARVCCCAPRHSRGHVMFRYGIQCDHQELASRLSIFHPKWREAHPWPPRSGTAARALRHNNVTLAGRPRQGRCQRNGPKG